MAAHEYHNPPPPAPKKKGGKKAPPDDMMDDPVMRKCMKTKSHAQCLRMMKGK